MIVVVSDLHLQHTTPEAIRHREGDVVWETGVRRNVPAEAVELLFEEIVEAAVKRRSRVVELVLAGDVFECHRAPNWFAGDDTHLRPTDAPGPDGSPLCRKTLRILEAVEAENQALLSRLRANAAKGAGGAPVRVHFVPGNHDRLVDLWPSTRRRVRAALGMPPSDDPFPRVLEWGDDDGGPGVRVRHGHEYDPPNIGYTDGALDYAAPCVGDFVTVDVAARLALAFRVAHARALREPGPAGDGMRALYAAVTEFDDVRPPSRLGRFLATRAGADGPEVMGLLRPVLADVYRNADRDAFFRRHTHGRVTRMAFAEPLTTLFRFGIARLPGPLLTQAVQRIARLGARAIGPALAEGAATEEGLGLRFHTVVSGHTHQPALVPLGERGGRDAWYANSGTWRRRLDAGVDAAWGLARACTMVFCFDDAEAAASPESGRIETWTGHFASDELGGYRERVASSGGPPRRLVLHEAEVLAGRVAGELEVGADGESRVVPVGMARAGDRIDLGGATLPLDGDLDGEVWAIGPRTFSGETAPWANLRLPREASGAFEPGERVLGLADHDPAGVRRVFLRVRLAVQ